MDSSNENGITDKLNGENNKPLVFAKKSQPRDIAESEFGQKASDGVTIEDQIIDESSNQAENSANFTPNSSASNSATRNEREMRCGFIINFTLKV